MLARKAHKVLAAKARTHRRTATRARRPVTVAYTDWTLDVEGCEKLHAVVDGKDVLVAADENTPNQCLMKPIHIPANSSTTTWLHGHVSDVNVRLTADEGSLEITHITGRSDDDGSNYEEILVVDDEMLPRGESRALHPGSKIRILESDEEMHSLSVTEYNNYIVNRNAVAHA